MFKIQKTILSEDIATVKFACNLSRCKGACCVVGNAGAPVDKLEIHVLKKAYKHLQDELRAEAVKTVQQEGLIHGDADSGYELNCVDDEECVFVTYDEQGVAKCAIQKAFFEGRFNWEKPMSCHLFPIRLKKIGDFEYANFEYVPSLCSAGCKRGKDEGIWLSDFLEEPLKRRYGDKWYSEFVEACKTIRAKKDTADVC
ncbi:MAG: DUF3109 family protein [Balneolaceae bacterium]|nr:DUF3109 family protein [Balneolaceae bacterium]